MRRIIPVNHARVSLTSITSAIIAALGIPSTSAIERADEREEPKFKRFVDSWFTLSSRTITPTIWPTRANTSLSLNTVKHKTNVQENEENESTILYYFLTQMFENEFIKSQRQFTFMRCLQQIE